MGASLPADLAQLKARFDHWRNTRTARGTKMYPFIADLLTISLGA